MCVCWASIRARPACSIARVKPVPTDALTEPRNGVPNFAVQVEVLPGVLAADVPLAPGMTAEGYVQTRDRKPLPFLL